MAAKLVVDDEQNTGVHLTSVAGVEETVTTKAKELSRSKGEYSCRCPFINVPIILFVSCFVCAEDVSSPSSGASSAWKLVCVCLLLSTLMQSIKPSDPYYAKYFLEEKGISKDEVWHGRYLRRQKVFGL